MFAKLKWLFLNEPVMVIQWAIIAWLTIGIALALAFDFGHWSGV